MIKILLVEDEPDQVEIIKIRLESSGFQVISAKNADEGIKLALEEKPDLILMDMILPGMHGLEATAKLKENPETKNIPIVALTAMNPPGFRQECFRTGVSDFVRKPFESADLIRKIEKNIGKKIKKKKAKKVVKKAKEVPEKQILIISDDPDICKTLEKELVAFGYKVLTASDPVKAVELANQEKPESIILDISMPVGEGYKVFFELKESNNTKKIPINVVSSILSEDELKEKSNVLKAAGYITKPYSSEKLFAAIGHNPGE